MQISDNLVPRLLTQAIVTCSTNVGNGLVKLLYRVMFGGVALLIFRLSTDICKWYSHKLLVTQANIVLTEVYRCLKLVEMQ